MNLFNPSDLKELCAQYGMTPSKHYGQHFLIAESVIKKMIAAAELNPQDIVIEIGPGFGVLTMALAPQVQKVIAFEIEQKLRPYWEEALQLFNKFRVVSQIEPHTQGEQKKIGNVEIVWGNALNEMSKVKGQLSNVQYKVVANLPYQITSEILETILEAAHKPERMVIMIQKEVAERIVAKPGEMSLLAVAVQYYGEPRIVAVVPAGSFWPAPKVDSAVLAITNIHDELEAKGFFQIVRAGFSHKRKQLWNNLSSGLHLPADQVKTALEATVDNPKVRAEELSIEEWRQLYFSLKTAKA